MCYNKHWTKMADDLEISSQIEKNHDRGIGIVKILMKLKLVKVPG